ncbi:MAG: SGNH/GDSL hydrolase family protein [Cyanobacteria bacterium SZAS-4]|nr:SGNH/GDSL hydrolase family protein [Cyanobacteria bacterium SZAS-4]
MAAEQTTTKQKGWRRLASSPFVLIVVFLIGVDAIATGLIPTFLPEWYQEQFPSPDRHCNKAIKYLSANDNEPSVVVLGSSLMRTAAEVSDMSINKELHEQRFANDYSKATYFENQLKKDLGADVSVLNLALRGCMASDYELIFQRAIELGKRPNFVVVATAPAEFMSNDQPLVNNTYVHQSLLKYKFPQGKPFYEVASQNIERTLAPHNLNAVEQFFTYLRLHGAAYLSDVSGHPTDLFRAAAYKGSKAPMLPAAYAKRTKLDLEDEISDTVKQHNPLADLSHYKMRYYPPNVNLYNQHEKNFGEMIRLAHENAIPLVVVNMPITGPNRDLVDPTLRERYYNFLKDTTEKYHVAYIDMDDHRLFSLTDFEDCSHLNSRGGKKFFSALAQNLIKKTDLSSIAATKTSSAL